MSLFLDGGPAALLWGVVPLLSCNGVTSSSSTNRTTTATTSPSPLLPPPPAATTSSSASQYLQQEITQRLQTTMSFSTSNPQGGHHLEEENAEILRLRRRHMARVEAGRSKTGIWGPTHSLDSQDTSSSSSLSSMMNNKGLKKQNCSSGDSPKTIVPPSQRNSPKTIATPNETTTTTTTTTTKISSSPKANVVTNTESPTKPLLPDPNPQGSTTSTSSSSSSPTSARRSASSTTAREPPPPTDTTHHHTATTTTTSSLQEQPQQQPEEHGPLHSEKSIWERATCTMLTTAPRYYFWKKQQPPQPHQQQNDITVDTMTVDTANTTAPPPLKALQRHADMLADFMEDACSGPKQQQLPRTKSLELQLLLGDVRTDDTLAHHTKDSTLRDDDDDDDETDESEDDDDENEDEVVVHEEVEVEVNALIPLVSPTTTAPVAIALQQQQQRPSSPTSSSPRQHQQQQQQADESSLRLVAQVTRSFQDARTTSGAITELTGGIPGPTTTTGTLDPPTLPRMSSIATTETPISRRRFRHFSKQSPPKAKQSPPRPTSASPTSMAVLKSPMPPLAPATAAAVQPPTTTTTSAGNAIASFMPLEMLTVKVEDAKELERSISELTMRSSYAEATAKISEQRRMAYYAVGRHHRNSGRGGNRRCYFSGKLILGGAPFYAGSVQQGLRTLVVFCLPSAIGLPLGVDLRRQESISSYASRTSGLPSSTSLTASQSSGAMISQPVNRELAIGVVAQPKNMANNANHTSSSSASDNRPPQNVVDGRLGALEREQRSSIRTNRSKRTYSASGSVGSKGQHSKISSLDDMSLSIEEDLDPNWGLDRDYLLQVLPEPDQDLLDEMAKRYPEQFETLPVQVRSPHCWRLFVKFCFFSGLPIAEGEMHYKVRDEIAQEAYGEEIILSHEVMEAVNGDSAEILRLPNQKTFRYLRKHYTQQSGKLPDVVFRRQSWILVRPEV